MSEQQTDEQPSKPPEPPLVKPDVVSKHDAAAIFGIFIRTITIDERLAVLRKRQEELNKSIAAENLIRIQGVNGLRMFGFDPSQPKIWDAVKEVLGEDTYRRAFDIAKGRDVEEQKADTKFTGLAEETGRGVDETKLQSKSRQDLDDSSSHKAVVSAQPKISDAVLAYLKDRAELGAKASEVRDHLVQDYGIETHEKTPGMTLYRLLRSGHARREGRTWFYVESVNDKLGDRNPDAEASGSGKVVEEETSG